MSSSRLKRETLHLHKKLLGTDELRRKTSNPCYLAILQWTEKKFKQNLTVQKTPTQRKGEKTFMEKGKILEAKTKEKLRNKSPGNEVE